MSESPKILYCRCKYANVVPQDVKDGVLQQLSESGVPFQAVPDLCEMASRNDPALKQLAEDNSITIVACYPRAVKALFHSAGAALNDERCRILNMRTETVEAIADELSVKTA